MSIFDRSPDLEPRTRAPQLPREHAPEQQPAPRYAKEEVDYGIRSGLFAVMSALFSFVFTGMLAICGSCWLYGSLLPVEEGGARRIHVIIFVLWKALGFWPVVLAPAVILGPFALNFLLIAVLKAGLLIGNFRRYLADR
ncbi:hypothetical protein DB346_07220 [Verrucomicrobia bacterium LW23]|nr:hypothetical protein DB346_07220 [Verrucomicrobia bacterium LW23]